MNLLMNKHYLKVCTHTSIVQSVTSKVLLGICSALLRTYSMLWKNSVGNFVLTSTTVILPRYQVDFTSFGLYGRI